MSPQSVLLILSIAASQPAFAKLEVHEWGTFTSLVGSSGQTQNGMYHEDEPLPGFVHGFGETAPPPPLAHLPPEDPTTQPPPDRPCHFKGCFGENFLARQVITQKMETPVLYFYSDQPQHVSVNVKFPTGVVTETFPAPLKTTPTRETVTALKNGDTTFDIDVLDPATDETNLPAVSDANIYSHARNVASNMIESRGEHEKFIFYRGLGTYQPKFDITSLDGSLYMQAPNFLDDPQANFLVDVDANGDARLMHVGQMKFYGAAISHQTIEKLRDHSQPEDQTIVEGDRAMTEIQDALVNAGLHFDEAAAMLATWKNGYLKVPGLRLLSILPRRNVDEILPLTISPTPDKLTRVFVSRIEILLDTEEKAIFKQVQEQGLSFNVETLGRFAEPKLRDVLDYAQKNALCVAFDQRICTDLKTLIAVAMKTNTTGKPATGSTD